ncbi:molybdate ABC transporter substrate-binding protein [Thalassotalea ponticola]|uniref:molybdate ABC transporter substrate-binding protein n=1 Tax=Thalassotalea ponticola TaxID=1523392 RepID=UPI0025B5D341|nr:molybdate ABC transporter substrate-binding protein [Thalassotalea ponticola]MDN3651901.1 molybdate ABC transporter substrate-binding protein [Thalassotalea ponticola]
MVIWRFWLCCCLLILSFQSLANELRIACAANFAKPLEHLLTEFNKQVSIKPKVSIGASGVLYQQLRHGAPFDIFFSADTLRPKLLKQQELIVDNAIATYAVGQLALWSNSKQTAISLSSLTNHQGRIAIADPNIAPYGQAAKEVLVNHNLWQHFQHKLVIGHNINQTYQHTLSGAVDYGFISYYQLLSSDRGTGVLIDPQLHQPLEQQMVILKSSKNIELARQLYQYVLSAEGQAIIAQYGYIQPSNTSDVDAATRATWPAEQ